MAWLRRNRWGLVFLLPALVALLALSVKDLTYQLHDSQLSEPVPAQPDGGFELLGTRIKLVDIGPATDLKGRDDETAVPPANVVVWRVRLAFLIIVPRTEPPTTATLPPLPGTPAPEVTLPPETQIGGCEITVEDADGRVFEDKPDDTLTGGAETRTYGCLAPYDADPLRYVNSYYFALPRGAEPVVVRISAGTLPQYVRLTR